MTTGVRVVENKVKLPSGVLKYLEGYHIDKTEIITSAETDMTLEGELARGYAILTKAKLILIMSEPDATDVYQFKGIGSIHEALLQKEREWAAKFFPFRITSYNVCYTKLLRTI